MQTFLPKCAVSFTLIIIAVLLLTPSTFAQTQSTRSASRSGQGKTRDFFGRPVNPGKSNVRLQGANLKACQARQAALTKRSEKLSQLATNMIEKFDAITLRVQEFYTSKLISENKVLPNYVDLLADIQTQKDLTNAALTSAQDNLANFNCTGNDPKGAITQFNADMQAVKESLGEYRTSVRNLMIAIKGLYGEEMQATESAKPSTKPARNASRSGGKR